MTKNEVDITTFFRGGTKNREVKLLSKVLSFITSELGFEPTYSLF